MSNVLHVSKQREASSVNEKNKRGLKLSLGFLKQLEQSSFSGDSDAHGITNQFAIQLHEDDNGGIRRQLTGDTLI